MVGVRYSEFENIKRYWVKWRIESKKGWRKVIKVLEICESIVNGLIYL